MTIPNVAVEARDNPSTRSGERAAVDKWIDLISDILAGPAQIRSRTTTYLPAYSDESTEEYSRRNLSAPWRPQFEDSLRHLTSKPFEEEVALVGDKVPEQVRDLAEDVDGRGNNITQFASEYFESSVAFGVSLLFVDFPTTPGNLTRQQELEAGVRPYWVLIPAKDVVALHVAYEGAREVVKHLRYKETFTRPDGFAEVTVERIRVYDDGNWAIWELDSKTGKWNVATENGQELKGTIKRGSKGLTSIPVVPLFTGKRMGAFQTRPALLSLADMQIELYRALSRKDEALTYAGSPILTGNGLLPPKPLVPGGPTPSLKVGPKSVLYAPASNGGATASWDYINPDASNIEQIREDVQEIQEDMRRAGMQPLTSGSGNQTATAHSIESAKAHSACKAWALQLKDCLEQAMVFTCQWLNLDDTVEVSVFTDFEVMPFAEAPLDALDKARGRGDISRRTYWGGLRRFSVLDKEFNPDEEDKRLPADAPRPTPALPGPDPEPQA